MTPKLLERNLVGYMVDHDCAWKAQDLKDVRRANENLGRIRNQIDLTLGWRTCGYISNNDVLKKLKVLALS